MAPSWEQFAGPTGQSSPVATTGSSPGWEPRSWPSDFVRMALTNATLNTGSRRRWRTWAYLLRAGQLQRLTEDHSVAAELVRSGVTASTRVAIHPFGNALTRSLGTGTASVESKTFEAWPGDRVLLCSDGLSDVIAEKEIARVLERFPGDSEKAAHGLVAATLEAGGSDNVTVVVVDVKDR